MAGLPVRFSELAERHLERLRGYHHELGGAVRTEELNLAVTELIERIRDFPRAYPVWRGPIRRIVSARFYLALYYRVAPDHIQLMAVIDQRQDPRRLRRFAGP